jgi:hypothetical protein
VRGLVPFFGALTCTLLVGHFVLPTTADEVYRPGLTPKLEALADDPTFYDIAFVGNSRVIHAVDPAVVDQVMAADGCSTRSINLGAPAMSAYEMREMMHALADRDVAVPTMVVTFDTVHLTTGLAQDFSQRNRTAASWSDLWWAPQYREELPEPPYGSSTESSYDVAAGILAAQIPMSAAYRRLFPDHGPGDDASAIDRLWADSPQHGGYVSLDDLPAAELGALHDERDAFVAAGGLDAMWDTAPPPADQVDRWVRTITTYNDMVPDGSRPVHVLLPSNYSAGTAASVTTEWNSDPTRAPLLNLFDLALVPGADQPEFWADATHVSRQGAVAVSTALAHSLCELVLADREA